MAATRTGRPAAAAAVAAARSGVPWGLASLRPGLAPFGGTDDEEDEDEEDDGEGARGAGEAGRPLPAVGVAPPSSRSLPPLLLLRALLVPTAGGVCSASASCALRFVLVLVLLPLPLGGLRPTMGPRPLGRLGCCWSSISITHKNVDRSPWSPDLRPT